MRKISSPCPLCFARILGFGFVVSERAFNPREMIADRFLNVRERILDVTTVAAVLCHTSLVLGDPEGLPEPVETTGQEERIRNKGLAAHLWRLRTLRQRKKRLRPPLRESSYTAVLRCRCTLLFCQRLDRNRHGIGISTRFGEAG